jgi:hypothetical protein
MHAVLLRYGVRGVIITNGPPCGIEDRGSKIEDRGSSDWFFARTSGAFADILTGLTDAEVVHPLS